MRESRFKMKAILFAGMLLMVFAGQAVHAQEIQITRADFCLGIENREPLHAVRNSLRLAAKAELFFWTEFQGGEKALQALEATGQLLVKHQWRRGIIVTDTIEVGI